MAAFVLNRESENCRQELYEYLVKSSLYKGMVMTRDSIVDSIENDLNLQELPPRHVNSALKSLQEKGLVALQKVKDRVLYLLSQDEMRKVEVIQKEYLQTVSQVKENLGTRMRQILQNIDEEVIFSHFRDFLAIVLSNLGKECCCSILASKGKSVEYVEPANMLEMLERATEKAKDERLREAEKEVFPKYISDPDDALRDFLYSLAQSYFFAQILNMDPDCQSLTRSALKRKRVYLDTNVIVDAITGVDRRHRAVHDALNLTSRLGITTIISEATKEEYAEFLRKRREAFGKEPNVPKERFMKISPVLEGGLLKDFLRKKSTSPTLTFDRYADRLEEVETIMRNRYSTISDDRKYKEIYEDEYLPQIMINVITEAKRFGPVKVAKVAEHDAFHILLMQELRKKQKGNILGPDFWFLTHDRSLAFVEKKLRHRQLPSSIFVDNWVQMISPLLSPEHIKSARDVYASLFASRLPILGSSFDERFFLSFQGQWMDDENLSPEDIARIAGNRYVREYYDLTKATKEMSQKEKDAKMKMILEQVGKQFKETRSLRRGMEDLRSEVDEWKGRSKRQTNLLSKVGHLFGAILFLVLWYLIYGFFVNVHSVEHWSALMGAMILASAFGAIADLFGYRWLMDRILRHQEKRQGS